MSARIRWLDWEPKTCIFSKRPETAPTQPTQPDTTGCAGRLQNLPKSSVEGLEGYVGPDPGQSQKFEAELDLVQLVRAAALLNQVGVRIVQSEGGDAIGVWSHLDSAPISKALRILGASQASVLYLDGPGVPIRYKVRRLPGDPTGVRPSRDGNTHRGRTFCRTKAAAARQELKRLLSISLPVCT